jgi:hypothetical protein
VDRRPAEQKFLVEQELLVQRMLVLIPSTTISESAMRMRAIAWSRVSPNAITLPTIES